MPAVKAPAASSAPALTPAQQRLLAAVTAELGRQERYDDQSLVHDAWIRQRYDGGYAASFAPARDEVTRTAWHEAGHAVAALAVGARFSSASVHHGRDSAGRVHAVTATGERSFVIAAAGQVAERLRSWAMLERDEELTAWLGTWTRDGDARQFRRALAAAPQWDEIRAWRHTEQVLTPRRTQIRRVARALAAWPRHLPYAVVAALAGPPPG